MSHKVRRSNKVFWAFALTSAAGFMVTLDNLVVTTALPVIPGTSAPGSAGSGTVNACTLTLRCCS